MNHVHPDFKAIEAHISRARVERAAAVGEAIAAAVAAATTWIEGRREALSRHVLDEHERRTIAEDPFLRRSVPRH